MALLGQSVIPDRKMVLGTVRAVVARVPAAAGCCCACPSASRGESVIRGAGCPTIGHVRL